MEKKLARRKFCSLWRITICCISSFISCGELLFTTSTWETERRVWGWAYLSSLEILPNQIRQNITRITEQHSMLMYALLITEGWGRDRITLYLSAALGSMFKSSNPFCMNIVSGIKCWLNQSALKKEKDETLLNTSISSVVLWEARHSR